MNRYLTNIIIIHRICLVLLWKISDCQDFREVANGSNSVFTRIED